MTKRPKQSRLIRFVYKAPVFLGYFYAVLLILNYREDTTNITNAGFAIMATLSALSFSFASVIDKDQIKDRIMFAGERFFHGALLVLISTLLKYFVLTLLKYSYGSRLLHAETAILFTIGTLIAIIFSNGVLFAHTGLRILNNLLLLRVARHKDWDDIW